MARRIVITSGKGGVGKTTVTANLGRTLARMGQRVVLLDIDLGLNNLDVAMNVENKVVYDLVDVIEGRCRIKQALIQDEDYEGLFILPSAHSIDKSKITGQNIKLVVSSLSAQFDYVLIDCPAGIDIGFHRAVIAAEEALVVITPHISAIRDADKVISLLKSYNLSSVDVIINRVRGDLVMSSEVVDADDVTDLFGFAPIAVIPEDDGLNVYSQPVGNRSEGALAFEILADNIHNGGTYLYDATRKYRGMFGKLKRNIRKLV